MKKSEVLRLGGIYDKPNQKHQRGSVYDENGLCPPLDTMTGGNSQPIVSSLKIRKLTPKECMRLMGFTNEDYQALKDIGMSDAAIYHIAGDSIVVPVLISIFSTMLYSDDRHKDIVKEYIEKEIIEK